VNRLAACSWFRGPRSNGTRFFRLLEAAERSLTDERSGLWGRLFNYCCMSNLKQSAWKLQGHGGPSFTQTSPQPQNVRVTGLSDGDGKAEVKLHAYWRPLTYGTTMVIHTVHSLQNINPPIHSLNMEAAPRYQETNNNHTKSTSVTRLSNAAVPRRYKEQWPLVSSQLHVPEDLLPQNGTVATFRTRYRPVGDQPPVLCELHRIKNIILNLSH